MKDDNLYYIYEGVELEKIWNIVVGELPRVKMEIGAILKAAGIDWRREQA